MKNKILFFSWCLIFNFSIIAIFDNSPWLIIENKTDFNFTCIIQVKTPDINEEQISIVCPSTIDALDVSIVKCKRIDETKNIVLNLNFVCKANTQTIIPEMFHVDSIYFNPIIQSIEITESSLQLTHDFIITNQENRHFIIDFNENFGLATRAERISLYIKLMHNSKESVRYFLTSALEKLNRLPY